jgi:CheY-like chemotaxis protein
MGTATFRALEQQTAEPLQSLQNQFLASLNHEIRTPLSGIIGMTDLLLETRLDPLQQEYLNTTRVCAEELLELFNAVLEHSALAAGSLALAESEFNLTEMLKGVLAQESLKAQAKHLRLIANLECNLPALAVGDGPRLRQILRHLIGNAIKFTPQGEVEVTVMGGPPAAGRFLLSVLIRDTGIGISPEHLRMLFQPFWRVENGLARKHSGLGLGLAVVDGLLRLMQGEITVNSQPGQGSVVALQVPLRIPAEVPSPSPAAGISSSSRPHRILLVDDNPVSQQIASHILLRGPYQLQQVSSGPEALEAVLQAHFDLILMDLQMPGMDGLETMQRIRDLPGYSQVPFIALTAYSDDDWRARCRQLGMQTFLSKPVMADELLAAVARHLSQPLAPRP